MNKRQKPSQDGEGISTPPQLGKASIKNLPTELLSIIFKFIHDESPQTNEPRDIIPSWMVKMDQGLKRAVKALARPELGASVDFTSPALFPYSVAAVCPLWSDILSSHPEFWTLVVIFVDSRYTSLAEATLILQRSLELPIHVVITRRKGFRMKEHPDLHEKCQIAALVNILWPHLDRCESLHIDTHLSSSLPVVSKALAGFGEAQELFSMELIPDIYDEQEDEEESDNPVRFYVDGLEPVLRFLVVDGHNFRIGTEEMDSWVADQVDLEQLTVMRYRHSPSSADEEPYTMMEFCDRLSSFVSLRHLKLHDIHFKTYACQSPGGMFHLDVQCLHLEDLDPEFIDAFFDMFSFITPSVLRITRSVMPMSYALSPFALILEEVVFDNSDLMESLDYWRGKTLCIVNCKGFSIELFGSKSDPFPRPGEPEIIMASQCLERLVLCRLSDFSIEGLKTMVDLRNRTVDYTDPNWRTTTTFGPALRSLAVVHCKVEKLSAADEQWFRSRIVEFYWVD